MIIETSRLRKTFTSRAGRRRATVEAVAGIDLAVKEGEIFGFLGPNGAGKSTTLHMLATLITPDGGEATIAGADLRRQPHQVRRRLGYVAQRGGTGNDVSAREELLLQARLYGLRKPEAQRRAERLLTDFQLTDYADRRCRTYSGGQRRRLDIALGVIHDPQVVLLDEPSAGLDPVSRSALWEEIRRLRDGGTTIVLTTHYLEEADALCDRVSIIDCGRIAAEGTPEELKQQVAGDVVTLTLRSGSGHVALLFRDQPYWQRLEIVDETTLRLYVDHGPTAVPRLMRDLSLAGVEILAQTLHQPSLDDVFLHKTGRSLHSPHDGMPDGEEGEPA
ncbi:ATP-binding cassette domain-containing protein [Streptosporangium sp. NPDC000396]|uniref:ATP-binding cassette domain-containing protein n=1 Tax=Streptosporangium sp. NPDC000396 TaxID=3366185 RepID=UPI0036792C85